MATVKLRITYDAEKLARNLPSIIEKLNSGMADRAKSFYRKNTLKGKDIEGNNFKKLSPITEDMRKRGLGTYKTPISHNRPLIASKKMVNSIQKVKKDTLVISGYGVYHNRERKKVPKRRWFGVHENVINNIVDNKKIKTFRKQIARAFKK